MLEGVLVYSGVYEIKSLTRSEFNRPPLVRDATLVSRLSVRSAQCRVIRMTYCVYLLRRIAMIKFYAMRDELNSVKSGNMYVVALRYAV